MAELSATKNRRRTRKELRLTGGFLCYLVKHSCHVGRIDLMRWMLLTLSLTVFLVSLLTWVRAPDFIWVWKLTIVATEFGHWLLILPLGLAGIAWVSLDGGVRFGCLLLCAGAVAGFLRPGVNAAAIARTLPDEMKAASLGGRGSKQSAFNPGKLFWHKSTTKPQTQV